MLRPIQYLGSKVRLLDAIDDAIDRVAPGRGAVVDMFSGSGVVAARLGRSRPVTAVDVQEYSRVLASALLCPARATPATIDRLLIAAAQRLETLAGGPVSRLIRAEGCSVRALRDDCDPQPLCEILEHGSIRAFELGEGPRGALAAELCQASTELDDAPIPTTLTRYYGGIYFSYVQAAALDCLLAVVGADVEAPARDTLLAAVLGAASECVTSVGSHFAQPVRPRDKHGRPKLTTLQQVARRRERDVFAVFAERLRHYAAAAPAVAGAAAVRSDYRAFLREHDGDVGAVYADPPYTRDHYSRFYHVLETMARGDAPQISTMTVGGTTSLSRGLYRRERHQSPFCIRSEVSAAFSALFAGVRALDAPLVLSYSPYSGGTVARPKSRLLTISEVVELASAAFRRVEICSAGRFSHSRFNLASLNGDVPADAEVLLICCP